MHVNLYLHVIDTKSINYMENIINVSCAIFFLLFLVFVTMNLFVLNLEDIVLYFACCLCEMGNFNNTDASEKSENYTVL